MEKTCPLLFATAAGHEDCSCLHRNCAWYVPERRTTGVPGIPGSGITVPGACALQHLAVILDKIYREP